MWHSDLHCCKATHRPGAADLDILVRRRANWRHTNKVRYPCWDSLHDLTYPFLEVRSAQRYAPVSGSCVATIQDIVELAKQLFPTHFESNPPRAVKVLLLVEAVFSRSCLLSSSKYRYAREITPEWRKKNLFERLQHASQKIVDTP